MDPQACLERWRRASEDGDLDCTLDAALDLREWLRKGGFEPEWADNDAESKLKAWCGR